MSSLDLHIRSPTGAAWFFTVLFTVLGGEIAYEVSKDEVATLFGVPFTDGELWPMAAFFGVAAAVALTWLASLYLGPGRIRVTDGNLCRLTRVFFFLRAVEAPLSAWQATVVYFNEDARKRRAFKRVELTGPRGVEILLFSDVSKGELLAEGLDALAEQLGSYSVEVQRGRPQ